MKPRKLILTIEVLTDIPIKDFTKISIGELFIEKFAVNEETFKIHQVRAQMVKENK